MGAKGADLVQQVSFEVGVGEAVFAPCQVGIDRRHVRLFERSIEVLPEDTYDGFAVWGEPTVGGFHVSSGHRLGTRVDCPPGNDTGIRGVGEQRLLNHAPRAEQARSHRTDGNVENRRSFVVRLILQVHEHEYGAMRLGKIGDRALDRRAHIEEIEQLAQPIVRRVDVAQHRRHRIEVSIIALNDETPTTPRVEEGVSTDGEEPSSRIAVGAKRPPATKCAEEGLLDQVVGVRAIASQRPGEPGDRIEVRQCGALEFRCISGH